MCKICEARDKYDAWINEENSMYIGKDPFAHQPVLSCVKNFLEAYKALQVVIAGINAKKVSDESTFFNLSYPYFKRMAIISQAVRKWKSEAEFAKFCKSCEKKSSALHLEFCLQFGKH
jgi:hypothetical protein